MKVDGAAKAHREEAMVASVWSEAEDPRIFEPEISVKVDAELEGGPDIEAHVHSAALLALFHLVQVLAELSVE